LGEALAEAHYFLEGGGVWGSGDADGDEHLADGVENRGGDHFEADLVVMVVLWVKEARR
jgi:hypothetical protein